jgi:hypothetical protein
MNIQWYAFVAAGAGVGLFLYIVLGVTKVANELAALQASATQLTATVQSAVTQLQTLAGKVDALVATAANGVDPVAVQSVADGLAAVSAALGQTVTETARP